jgi:hypothetical protein
MWDEAWTENSTELSINFMNIVESINSKYPFTTLNQNTLGRG